MNGNEQLSPGLVGYGSAVPQFYEFVGTASHDYLDIGILFLDSFAQQRCDGKSEILFVEFLVFTDCTCIFSSVPRIYHYGTQFQTLGLNRKHPGQQRKEYADCVFQK